MTPPQPHMPAMPIIQPLIQPYNSDCVGQFSVASKVLGHSLDHTLRIGCTELKAVPHAGLGYQFLRVQVRKPEKEVEVHQVQRGHQL